MSFGSRLTHACAGTGPMQSYTKPVIPVCNVAWI